MGVGKRSVNSESSHFANNLGTSKLRTERTRTTGNLVLGDSINESKNVISSPSRRIPKTTNLNNNYLHSKKFTILLIPLNRIINAFILFFHVCVVQCMYFISLFYHSGFDLLN